MQNATNEQCFSMIEMCTTDKWMSEFFLTQRDGGPPNPRDSAKPQCD